MSSLVNQLTMEESRNACDCPQRWQLIDAIGTIMGAYFAVDSVRRLRGGYDGWAVAELSLATTMMFIHSSRFFWTKSDLCKSVC
jgi:hypothetical protein